VVWCAVLSSSVPENPLQFANIMQGSPSLLKSLSAYRERESKRERHSGERAVTVVSSSQVRL
jgi:hypothetical protein